MLIRFLKKLVHDLMLTFLAIAFAGWSAFLYFDGSVGTSIVYGVIALFLTYGIFITEVD
jgi:hypothetical protein